MKKKERINQLEAEIERLAAEHNSLLTKAADYHGKNCQLQYDLDMARKERNEAEQHYSDLIHLCENTIAAYDEGYGPLKPATPKLAHAIESIRHHVSPTPDQKPD
jgi:hypothetical protein